MGAEPRTPEPPLRRLAILPFVLGIRVYQVLLAPFLSGHCRFLPTCSNYALDAYRAHGPLRGTWLTVRRLARCHPWGGHGFDPVPDQAQPSAPASARDEHKCQRRE